MHTAVKKVSEEGVFGFGGIKAKTTFFGNVTLGTDEQRENYLASIKHHLA